MPTHDDIHPPSAENARSAASCAAPGCAAPAAYRAPCSRRDLGRFVWFCLDHVRQYNASWDYCAGMDADEIEAHLRADVVWRRPSWPWGAANGAAGGGRPRMHGGFGPFGRDPAPDAEPRRQAAPPRPPVGRAERAALAVMALDLPTSAAAIKARYKSLVKRLHPDANGGDKRAEERLKSVTQAYATLRRSDACGWCLPRNPSE